MLLRIFTRNKSTYGEQNITVETISSLAFLCSVFRPGVEYIYRYESEALTGIRTVSDQLSGVKVRATVKIQIHRDGSTLLKVCCFTSIPIQVRISKTVNIYISRDSQM